MEPQVIEGLVAMVTICRRANRGRSTPINILGIVPNMFKQVALHKGILETIREEPTFQGLVLDTPIGHRIAFAESDHPEAQPKSVFQLTANHKARQEAEAFCAEIERRMTIRSGL